MLVLPQGEQKWELLSRPPPNNLWSQSQGQGQGQGLGASFTRGTSSSCSFVPHAQSKGSWIVLDGPLGTVASESLAPILQVGKKVWSGNTFERSEAGCFAGGIESMLLQTVLLHNVCVLLRVSFNPQPPSNPPFAVPPLCFSLTFSSFFAFSCQGQFKVPGSGPTCTLSLRPGTRVIYECASLAGASKWPI